MVIVNISINKINHLFVILLSEFDTEEQVNRELGLGLWCLTPDSTIFQLYRGLQFYWWTKPAYPWKNTAIPQVTDKIYSITMYRVHFASAGLEQPNGDGHRVLR